MSDDFKKAMSLIQSPEMRERLMAGGGFKDAAHYDRFLKGAARELARSARRPQKILSVGERDLGDLLKLLGCADEEIRIAVKHGPLAVVVYRQVLDRIPTDAREAFEHKGLLIDAIRDELHAGVDEDSADAIIADFKVRVADKKNGEPA